jgi:hypothetical protein
MAGFPEALSSCTLNVTLSRSSTQTVPRAATRSHHVVPLRSPTAPLHCPAIVQRVPVYSTRKGSLCFVLHKTPNHFEVTCRSSSACPFPFMYDRCLVQALNLYFRLLWHRLWNYCKRYLSSIYAGFAVNY